MKKLLSLALVATLAVIDFTGCTKSTVAVPNSSGGSNSTVAFSIDPATAAFLKDEADKIGLNAAASNALYNATVKK